MSSSPNQEQITLNLCRKCSLSCASHPLPSIYLSAGGFSKDAPQPDSAPSLFLMLLSRALALFLSAIVAELD